MGITPDQFPQQFEAMRAWWMRNGFTPSRDAARGTDRDLGAMNGANGFGMSLTSNDSGELFLDVSSPCVWRNGTPEPSS